MPPYAADRYINRGRACQRVSGAIPDAPCFNIGGVVKRYGIIRLRYFVIQAVAEHRPGPVNGLLGGLAYQDPRSMPLLFKLGEHLRGPKQAGNVDVVTASVHHAHILSGIVFGPDFAGIRKLSLFFDWQRVHVRPYEHGWSGAVFQYSNHSVPGPAGPFVFT